LRLGCWIECHTNGSDTSKRFEGRGGKVTKLDEQLEEEDVVLVVSKMLKQRSQELDEAR
jgi:hypothetical protein